jgi:site-specific recombinase XerD
VSGNAQELDKPGHQIFAPALILPQEVPSLAMAPFLRRALSYAYQSRSTNTLRGYQSDWRSFSWFSEGLGIEPMPARPDTVASYLSACADSGLKAGTIQRRAAAIAAMHRAAGYDSPTSSAAVKLCLAGIRRVLGTRETGKSPAITTDIAAMCSHLPSGLLGIRDRAILLNGFAGAFRRSELVALDVEDLEFGDLGLRVTYPT